MHLHSAESPQAVCRGFNFASAPWVKEEAEDHKEWEVPHLKCSCGYRGTFTIPSDIENKCLAHVTALGETWIHDEGFRTAKYFVNFFLKPPSEDLAAVLHDIAAELDVPIFEVSNCEQCSSQRRKSTDQGSVDP